MNPLIGFVMILGLCTRRREVNYINTAKIVNIIENIDEKPEPIGEPSPGIQVL
jgi:hypothetical protein